MKHHVFSWGLVLSILIMGPLVSAHEMTGWKAPEDARKMKNPIKPTKDSVEKGKEIYSKKCALCHGEKGDGKGPAAAGLSPAPTNFRDSHGENMTDGEHFWKITTGRGPMPSFEKDLSSEQRWDVINYINTFQKRK